MTITQSSTRIAALTLGVAAIVAVALSVALAAPAQAAGICPGTTWNVNLKQGATSSDVMKLQQFLNMDPDTMVASVGAGSPGNETSYFGALTTAAVKKFQAKYAPQILTPLGLTTPTPNFYASSRAEANALCAGSTGSTGSTVPVTGNGLKVVLSPSSPNNTVLVAGQGIGDLADFTFVNPTNAAILVSNLSFKRIGVSNDSTVNNVYLYNGVNRLTDSAGISNSSFSFNNPGGIFVVPAGGTYTVSVRADIATGTSGQQLGAQLVSVGATGTLDTNTSFPINSYTQGISNASLATVDFSTSANTIPAATTISPQSSFTLWQNTVSVSQNPVWLKSMRFTNLGSADNTAVSNLRLYVDGVQVGPSLPSMNADRTATFDLSASPVTLSTQSHVVKVLGDVVGGASRTVQLSLQRSSDALMVDSQLGQPVTPTVASASFTAVSAGAITVQSTGVGGVSVNKNPASNINNIAVGSSNLNLATFDFLAAGEPTKVQDLFVCANTEAGGINGAGGGLANGKIFFNGVQVGSTKAIVECNTTPAGTDFSLGSSLILPAGQTASVSVYADAKVGVATSSVSANTNLPTNDTVQIKLIGSGSLNNGQGQSSLTSTNVPAASVTGNLLSVTNSTLTATKYSGYSNQTMIPGTQNALLGAFTLSVGSTEAVNVNTITISASTTPAAEITNLTLKDSTGNTLGTVIPTPSGTSASTGGNAFNVNLNVPASGTQTVYVYGNILASATTNIQLGVPTNGITGTGATTGLTSTAAPVQLQTISVGSGQLSVGLGASNPVSSNIVAGSATPVKVGSFTFSAQNTPFTVQKLEVDVPVNSATAISTLSIQYKDTNGVTQTVSQALQTGASTSTAQFTGLTFNVPANDSADVSVWVTTPSIANGGAAISGTQIVADLNHSANFQAVDQSGNATTTPYTWGNDVISSSTSGYGVLVVRKSVPTFANQTLSNTNVAAGQAIYRFNVTADNAGAVDLAQVAFNISTSSTLSNLALSGFTVYDVTSGSATALNGSPVSTVTGGIVKVPFTSLQQVGAGQTKTYELRAATVSNWTTGGNVTVSLAQDSSYVSNVDASTREGTSNIVWSDRSATNHASAGLTATDWTNGYLLKDFVNDVTSFNHS